MSINRTILRDGVLTIGEEGSLTVLASQCPKVELVPSVKRGDPLEVLSGETTSGDRSESWNLKGTLIQDIGHANSVWEFCFTNRGKDFPFRFVPNTATTDAKSLSGVLTVEAITAGGDVGKAHQSDFDFSLVGEPVLAAYAPTP